MFFQKSSATANHSSTVETVQQSQNLKEGRKEGEQWIYPDTSFLGAEQNTEQWIHVISSHVRVADSVSVTLASSQTQHLFTTPCNDLV